MNYATIDGAISSGTISKPRPRDIYIVPKSEANKNGWHGTIVIKRDNGQLVKYKWSIKNQDLEKVENQGE